MNVDITVIVGMGCTVVGAIIGIWKAKKDTDKDTREDAVKDTTALVKLDYISKGVDDIRLDIKAQDRKIQDIVIDITKLKESTKSAHHRLDNLEEK
ncbi:MAG: hypothetical protein ACRCVJ_01015 [Clostridium sp.]|uniref:hypothetical protein n=1 Tax=Clostridium sp. TaxID=1506 RepID=UPI003F414838